MVFKLIDILKNIFVENPYLPTSLPRVKENFFHLIFEQFEGQNMHRWVDTSAVGFLDEFLDWENEKLDTLQCH